MIEQAESMTGDTSASTDSISAQFFGGFADPNYRQAYADEHLTTFIPFQIRAIREQRGWTQTELGARCGGKAQAWISQLEDPNYGRFSLATLKALARAFDCILDVRFRSFRDYSDEQERRRSGDLRVNTYDEDAKTMSNTADVDSDTVSSKGQAVVVLSDETQRAKKKRTAKAALRTIDPNDSSVTEVNVVNG